MKNIFSLLLSLLLLSVGGKALAQCDYTDDFNTLPPATATSWTTEIYNSIATTAGWLGENINVVTGGTLTTRNGFRALGAGAQGICLQSGESSITSPMLNNVDEISMKISRSNTTTTRKIKVEVIQNEQTTLICDTVFNITSTSSATLLKVKVGALGDYQIKISKSISSESHFLLWDICITKVIPPHTYTITAPKDATVFVGQKDRTVNVEGHWLQTHYIPFAEKAAVHTAENGASKTWYYNVSGIHNYRVSREGSITQVGTFTPSAADTALAFTDSMLTAYSPKAIDHDVNSLLGRNVADIFLNINGQGHLTLPLADTAFQIVNCRVWQAINNDVDNYFIEPDFHYAVVNESGAPDNSVVTVSSKGVLTPVGAGTAIVLVTYDAMVARHTRNVGNNGNAFFSALWAENTGVFVVTVNALDNSGIESGMLINQYWNDRDGNAKVEGTRIDAEHDVLYYEADKGSFAYTFTPENVESVLVATPAVGANSIAYSGFSADSVTANADGSYTVRVTFGRNIVKLVSANGAVAYQVLTAKPVTYTVSNLTRPNAEKFRAGDEVSVLFNTLYHPATKLAGIYNQSAGIQYTGDDVNFPLILGPGQYTFSSAAQTYKMKIQADFTGDEYLLTQGVIKFQGFGSGPGAHRAITLQNGVNPNLNASVRLTYCGSLPEIRLAMVDLTPPTVPTNLAGVPTENTIALSWTASTDNAGVAGYRVYVDGALKDTVTETAYTATGLTPHTMYHVEVDAFDEAGNVSAKASLNIRTSDEGAPTAPGNLRGIPSETTIALSWNASVDNVGVAGYNVYVDDIKVATVTDTTYIVTGLTKGTQYVIAVEAFDFEGNKSESVITISTIDNAPTAPTNLAGVPTETTIALSWEASVGKVAAVVGYRVYIDGVLDETVSKTSFIIGGLTAGTTYVIGVEAFDAVGNTSERALITVATVNTPVTSVSGLTAESTLSVYPNPFDDYITVNTSVGGIATIYSISGSVVLRTNLNIGSNRIEVAALPRGVYVLKVGKNSVKIVK